MTQEQINEIAVLNDLLQTLYGGLNIGIPDLELIDKVQQKISKILD